MNKNLLVVGLNHKIATVEIREKIAFQDFKIRDALSKLKTIEGVSECIILSTCNRVELYLVTDLDSDISKSIVIDFISSFHNLKKDDFVNYLYFYFEKDAVKHIFRVASSLDSLVVGEPQILGQLKLAYRIATEEHTTKVILNKLLHKSFSVAKRVRTETEISGSAVSISFAAVELSKRIFETLKEKKILLVGAGEMCELAARHLIGNGVTDIFVANRTFERAENLASEFGGKAVSFENLYLILEKVDIVIASTGAPHYIIEYPKFKDLMKIRRNKPIFMIDIAVPRDIDPKINTLDGVYLYDIDDLKAIVEKNWESRKNEAEKAEVIVDGEVAVFLEWFKTLDIIPTIVKLREYCENIRRVEADKFFEKINGIGDKEREMIDYLTSSIINKILHKPSINLKRGSESEYYAEAVKKIFDI